MPKSSGLRFDCCLPGVGLGRLSLALLLTLAWTAASAQQPPASSDAWGSIAAVLTSPRCLNCHPRGDHPTQGDAMRRHRPDVQRGPDGTGVAAMRCSTCHQERNQDIAGVPGAQHWHVAPASMGWAGLPPGELCRAIKDPSRNGGRTLDDLVRHMTGDALVRWAWTPGKDRTPPPVSIADLAAALDAWVKAGGPCPN